MAGRTPPRFVPTLTEVVKPSTESKAAHVSDTASQELIIQRVMTRVDMTLERRLREAIAATVLEQTRSIAPMLRSEIEAVVRETVEEAFAEELAAGLRR
jgi:tRNA uridine 5-carbamoylmethylation protein Kti12